MLNLILQLFGLRLQRMLVEEIGWGKERYVLWDQPWSSRRPIIADPITEAELEWLRKAARTNNIDALLFGFTCVTTLWGTRSLTYPPQVMRGINKSSWWLPDGTYRFAEYDEGVPKIRRDEFAAAGLEPFARIIWAWALDVPEFWAYRQQLLRNGDLSRLLFIEPLLVDPAGLRDTSYYRQDWAQGGVHSPIRKNAYYAFATTVTGMIYNLPVPIEAMNWADGRNSNVRELHRALLWAAPLLGLQGLEVNSPLTGTVGSMRKLTYDAVEAFIVAYTVCARSYRKAGGFHESPTANEALVALGLAITEGVFDVYRASERTSSSPLHYLEAQEHGAATASVQMWDIAYVEPLHQISPTTDVTVAFGFGYRQNFSSWFYTQYGELFGGEIDQMRIYEPSEAREVFERIVETDGNDQTVCFTFKVRLGQPTKRPLPAEQTCGLTVIAG